ncbi:MAG TPA: dihydroorotate dehydrogenase electron transfer subunit [Syntrophobacter fumaroxidans]|nr:dihydroorotate dehydrogenase electron transfer subunit [Syntrophobacter fumaroxidans]
MPKFQENALILDHREVADRTWLMRLMSPKIALEARAGQFVMVRVRDGIDPLLRRPLSFHRTFPEEGCIELLYRVVGKGTLLLSKTVPGMNLDLLGPLGNGFDLPAPDARGPIALIAGGIGIAPLFDLMERIALSNPAFDPQEMNLFYGTRTVAEFLALSYFGALGVRVRWSTDDGSFGHKGYVTRMFAQFAEESAFRPESLYACGPLEMQFHVARWALAHDVPAQLSLESLMACGLGACLGCALPAASPDDPAADGYVHVCKDGPIFPAGAVQWQKLQVHRPPPPIFLSD